MIPNVFSENDEYHIERAVDLSLQDSQKIEKEKMELMLKLVKKIETDIERNKPILDAKALDKLDTLIKLQKAILKAKNLEEINNGKK